MDSLSSVWKGLKPLVQAEINRQARGGGATALASSPSGGVAAHALYGVAHTGTLDRTQAPWVATDIASHAALPNVHHAQQHSMVGGDHVYGGGNALDVFGLSAPSTLGLLSPSSAPGATAKLLKSTAAGGLTLESLNTNGAATIGQDLYAGASAFRVIYHTSPSPAHVHVVVNPTGGWTLDEQFGVDIDDNLLVRGWIVGKHAIQLKDAALIAHFDGSEPVKTDYTGETNGHMGQPGVMTGSYAFRPGKFGKGIQTNEATTNGCTNPSAETNATNWTEQYDSLNQLTIQRVTNDAFVGTASIYIDSTAASTYVYNQPHLHAPASTFTWNNGETVTISAYVKGNGTWRIIFEDAGENFRAFQSVTLTTADDWQRVVITATNSSGSNYGFCRMSFLPFQAGVTYLRVDAVQYEKRAYATAYFDGSFGQGYAWTGTAHASSSTATAGYATYSNVVLGSKWTAMLWAYRDGTQGHNWSYLANSNTDYNAIYYNSSNADVIGNVSAGAPSSAGWYHYVLVADGTARTAYRNGVLIGSSTASFSPGTTWYVAGSGGAYAANTVVDEFVLCNRALSADEVRTIYESDAPVFAETSTWHFRAGKNLVWADSEGLWMLDSAGYAVLGAYGDSGAKGWGGLTLNQGDILIGDASRGGYLQWDNSAATLYISGTAALIQAGATKVTLSSTGLRLNRESSSSDFGYHAGASIEWTGGYNSIYGSDFVGYLGAGTVGYRTLVRTKTATAGEYALATLQAELYTGAKATVEARAEPGGLERVDVTADELRVVGRLGINSSSTPPAQAGIYQSGSAAAIPALLLTQDDVSEEFVEFSGTVAAGNPIDTAALGTYYGKVRVSVNGTFKYIGLYN